MAKSSTLLMEARLSCLEVWKTIPEDTYSLGAKPEVVIPLNQGPRLAMMKIDSLSIDTRDRIVYGPLVLNGCCEFTIRHEFMC